MACNTLICSGRGLEHKAKQGLPDSALREILRAACEEAHVLDVVLQWYSPTCYTQGINPLELGFGVKSCSAAAHNMTVQPDGSVLPCQSWPETVGNILTDPWPSIWNHPVCRELRSREHVPEDMPGLRLYQHLRRRLPVGPCGSHPHQGRGAAMKKLLCILPVLACLLAMATAAHGDTGSYTIPRYIVALTPHADGTVDISYDQRWTVTGGHIPWITIGTPNSDFTISGFGGAVKSASWVSEGEWSGVRLDLDRDYQPGESFTVHVGIRQRGSFMPIIRITEWISPRDGMTVRRSTIWRSG